jgi:hypothetical protein
MTACAGAGALQTRAEARVPNAGIAFRSSKLLSQVYLGPQKLHLHNYNVSGVEIWRVKQMAGSPSSTGA